MNKIISISINGIIFNVDEHAYLTLKNYLDALKLHFSGTEGRDEILSDIEARIAEMLLERMKVKREVVTQEDVNAVMAAMGKPEDMGDAENAKTSQTGGGQTYTHAAYTGSRRVFRNPDDKILGGVCSGIANYFAIDPLILRLIFVVAFFGFGSGLLLYIILWIIIPLAKTPSEKLEMKGERVNVSNIERTVKENLNEFQGRVNAWGDELKNTDTSKLSNFFTSLANDLVRVLKPLLMILLKILAIFFVFVAGVILIGLIISLLGFWGVIAMKLPAFMYDIFDTRNDMLFGSLGFTLLFGIPVIALLYFAVRIIFNIKYSNKWIGMALVMAWLTGIGLVAVTSVRAINNFGREETLVENVELPTPKTNPLYLELNNTLGLREIQISYNQPDDKKMMRVKVNKSDILRDVKLDIVKSETGKMELIKEFSAHGSSDKEARLNASKIKYNINYNDSQIIFDKLFELQDNSKWRAQAVKLILKVPVGQTIIMKRGMEHIIYDIDNTTNTYDGKMIGYKWMMTERGLSCQDCPEHYYRKHDDTHDRDWEIERNSYHSAKQKQMLII